MNAILYYLCGQCEWATSRCDSPVLSDGETCPLFSRSPTLVGFGRNHSFRCWFQRNIGDCVTLMLKWQEENICAGFGGADRSGIIKNHTQHCCRVLEALTVRVRLSNRGVVQFSNFVLARINLNLHSSKGTLQTDLVDVFVKWFLFWFFGPSQFLHACGMLFLGKTTLFYRWSLRHGHSEFFLAVL